MKKTFNLFIAVFILTGISTLSASPKPIKCKLLADFGFNVDSCKVAFFDSSKTLNGSIKQWYWSFGDGQTANVQNPNHTYTKAGTYQVCLTVVSTNGFKRCKDRICKKVTVAACGNTTACQITPKFGFKTDSCKVTFTDSSLAGLGTTIGTWSWSFGDGQHSNVQNPSHVYTQPGTYNVCLTVVGTNGKEKCKERVCLKVDVKACKTTLCIVKPRFTYTVDSCTVSFYDSTVTLPGTVVTKTFWKFGDGDTSSQHNPTHVYKKSGEYEVCLTVVGQNGQVKCEQRVCRDIKVKNCGSDSSKCRIKADFSYKVDSCTAWFSNSTTTGSGTNVLSHYWKFGDGDTSSQKDPIHIYKKAGTYEVCLMVVGQNGQSKCDDRVCKKVTVKNCGPQPFKCVKPAFTYINDSCDIIFKDVTLPGIGLTVTGWNWKFGDGSTDSTQNPIHTYKKSGEYKVCLTVTAKNVQGQTCHETYCQEVRVRNCGNSGPDCQLKPSFGFKVDSCTVSFFDSSMGTNGTTITNWYWNFGNNNDTSTAKNPVFTFKHGGKHRVCLTVVGINGKDQCKETICESVVVTNCKKKVIGDPLDRVININGTTKFQIYPNPAQNITNISFELANNGQVNVTVTDIQGRVVATLQNGYMANGYHQLTWKASDEVPSGLYLITVKTDTSLEQKTLMLQK